MDSHQRIQAAVRFEPTDRVPVIAQVFGHAATVAGIGVDEYVRDGAAVARCQLTALERYGYDAVFATLDVNVETEACGSKLDYRLGTYPVVDRHALDGDVDLSTLEVPDPASAARMPELLQALRLLRGELGDEVLVVGCVLGPFTLATQLLGMERALYLAIDDPSRLEAVMDFATEVLIRFGIAQVAAGAHLPVVFDPSASPAVVPPSFFREFELPRLQRLFTSLAEAGAEANWLHIAGPAQGILPLYGQAGVDIANFDYCVPPEAAAEALPTTCLDGSVRPVCFVEDSPAAITLDAERLLAAFADRGGFILSSGCEIPPEARPENVEALVGAVRAAV